MDSITIRRIIELVSNGQLRVPAFQRGFVWDSDHVAFFLDSVFKGYPFGSVLLWRTRESLRFERQLGPYHLQERDPEYPVDYILDGQQRITSLFGVFQTELAAAQPDARFNVFFDLRANADIQESQFVNLNPDDYDRHRYFPLNALFNTVNYRRLTRDFTDDEARSIDRLQEKFKEATIPVQIITTENRNTVAIVFERVNQRGVELDTLQLLTAWTWSEEFDLQRQFTDLRIDIAPFGFEDLADETNLILRCVSAVVASDPSPDRLVTLNGADVRGRFKEVENGIKGAIDFLRNELKVYSIDLLPYRTLLVPLSVFFAIPGAEQRRYTDTQRRRIVRWFWRTCFARRYSDAVLRNLTTDIEEMLHVRNNQENSLGDFTATVSHEFFMDHEFRINTVASKTHVLLLAQRNPRSFISGALITLSDVLARYNRNEFHHIFPKRFLKDKDIEYSQDCLANICFISRTDNNQISSDSPSTYRAKMPEDITEILDSACCMESMFDDEFDLFVPNRAEMLATFANTLL